MEFQDILLKRKSVRHFSDQSVSRELIYDILRAGAAAPTSCNQQLWRFVVVDDPKVKDELIAQAYSSTLIRRAAAIIIVMYDGWNYKEAIQAGSMAIMNMLNRCCELGLGSTAMNSFGNATVIKKLLNIPQQYVICAFVALGYSPDVTNADISVIPRRPVEEMVSFNGFNATREYRKSYSPADWSLEQLADYQQYFCRKTTLGKEMDLNAAAELAKVEAVLKKVSGPVLDVFSYDGSYLKYFAGQEVYSLNLNAATGQYVERAAQRVEPALKLRMLTLSDLAAAEVPLSSVQSVTLVMKAERISVVVFEDLLRKLTGQLLPGTKLYIIARKNNLFLNCFHALLKMLFGNDIRKTGIYSFWGPYAPIDLNQWSGVLTRHGWGELSREEFFLIPAFFQQILQMMIQYFKSGKTSYLHRERHENFFTRCLDAILRWQGDRATRWGSLAVLTFEFKQKNHA